VVPRQGTGDPESGSRLSARYRGCRNNQDGTGRLTADPRDAERRDGAGEVPTPQRDRKPNIYYGLRIDVYSDLDLREAVRYIESDTLLRTEDQLLSDVRYFLGFQKRGRRIVERIRSAIRAERA
jgi:hypothetical protein